MEKSNTIFEKSHEVLMRFMLLIIFLLLPVFTPIASFSQEIDALDGDSADHITESSKPDMTELFGPDYRKGDIGHSYGVIKTMTAAGDVIIEHGKIHGTDIEAATTEFEVLQSADLSKLVESSHVEFLIKKGDDDGYRVLSICKLTAENSKCL